MIDWQDNATAEQVINLFRLDFAKIFFELLGKFGFYVCEKLLKNYKELDINLLA